MLIGSMMRRFHERCPATAFTDQRTTAWSLVATKLAAKFVFGNQDPVMMISREPEMDNDPFDFSAVGLAYVKCTGKSEASFVLREPFVVELAHHLCKALPLPSSPVALHAMELLVLIGSRHIEASVRGTHAWPSC